MGFVFLTKIMICTAQLVYCHKPSPSYILVLVLFLREGRVHKTFDRD